MADVQYDDITCTEAVQFCLPDPGKARDDTLNLVQVTWDIQRAVARFAERFVAHCTYYLSS